MNREAWGLVMIGVGALFPYWGTVKSGFLLYRLFVARSKSMMKENVHRFYQFSGVMIMFMGLLMSFGVF